MFSRKLTACLLLFLFCLLTFAFLFRVKNKMVDFEVNYTAAKRLRLGETLYRSADGHYQFKYLPFSALLYLPVSFLPLALAKAAWYGVVICCSFLIFFLSFRLISPEKERFLWVAVLPPLILAKYFLREIQLGQINALITLLLLAMILKLLAQPSTLDRRRGGEAARQVAAGLFGGLATALKPYALIFFPYFIIRKKWLCLATSIAVLILGIFSPSLFYGVRGNFTVLKEWQASLAASTPSLFSAQDNVSLLAFLMKWTGHQTLSLFLYFFVLAGLGLLSLLLFAKGKPVPQPGVLDCFLLLALIPLISPLGWDYTFLSSAPAVMLLLYHFDKYRPFWRVFLSVNFAVIALSLFDLMGREIYASFMSLSIITINFIVLVGYVSFLRLKGHA
jgi:alpha-1,2-mannosyltransferase